MITHIFKKKIINYINSYLLAHVVFIYLKVNILCNLHEIMSNVLVLLFGDF